MSSDHSEASGGSAKVDATEIDNVKPFEKKGKMKGEKTSKAVKKGKAILKVKRNTEDEKTVVPAYMEADVLPEKVEEKKTDMEIEKERSGVVGYEKYLTETGSKLASDQSKETSEVQTSQAKPLTKEENYEVLEKQKIENREAAGDEAAESGEEGILEEERQTLRVHSHLINRVRMM
ncbi:uncharacterized protein LOC122064478 isoform X2 [Macadamia integrifolia]|uniref:uncharacterized protein LOC122064478 isoform X2 n=1 Tax=Macadamia integrifolia TaxID=60698 RepID=UPI001C4FE070|nr:uncharacterized protein LOC122064478 isoform X2 [Macadamia integrifolia]